MSFLAKVRTLVGALVHKPFAPRPEKAQLEGSHSEVPSRQHNGLEEQARVDDTERVADLISQQKQDADG